MNLAPSVLGIALIVVLPTVQLLNRAEANVGRRIAIATVLYVVWFLTYAPFHEACHYVAARAQGLGVTEVQLIPAFWRGEFRGAHIDVIGQTPPQQFLISVSPYVRDVVMVVLGWTLLRSGRVRGVVGVSAVLMLFVLSSLFDVVENYGAWCLGVPNDFWGMAHFLPVWLVHVVGLTILGTVLIGAVASTKVAFDA